MIPDWNITYDGLQRSRDCLGVAKHEPISFSCLYPTLSLHDQVPDHSWWMMLDLSVTTFLEEVEIRLSTDASKFQQFLLDVETWIKSSRSKFFCVGDKVSAEILIQRIAFHLRSTPQLLHGLNTLIRPDYRLECLTSLPRVNHYVFSQGEQVLDQFLLNAPLSCGLFGRRCTGTSSWTHGRVEKNAGKES